VQHASGAEKRRGDSHSRTDQGLFGNNGVSISPTASGGWNEPACCRPNPKTWRVRRLRARQRGPLASLSERVRFPLQQPRKAWRERRGPRVAGLEGREGPPPDLRNNSLSETRRASGTSDTASAIGISTIRASCDCRLIAGTGHDALPVTGSGCA
jgi:hypothetical protein